MALDPSIFYNFAALNQQSDQNLANMLAQGMSLYRDRKAKEGFDLEKGVQGAVYKAATGQQLSPEELGYIKTFSILQGPKVTYQPDAAGQVRAVTQPSIWDTFSQMTGQEQYPGQFKPMAQAPMAPNLGAAPISMADLVAPQAPMSANPPSALTPQQQQALQARGDVFNRPAQDLPQIVAPQVPYGANELDVSVGKAQIDLQKKAIENKMAREEKAREPIGLEQGKVATFADRMIDANSQLADLVEPQTNLYQRNAAGVPVLGNFITSSKYQKASQAERNFINAVLRRESGAVISPEEFENARLQYFPQPGDSPDVVRQKSMNRQTVIDGFIREAGPAYKPKTAGNKSTDLPEGAQIIGTSGGKKVYQLPDGSYIKEK